MIITKSTNHRWTEEEKELAVTMYYDRIPLQIIADHFDVSYTNIQTQIYISIKKRGLEPLRTLIRDPYYGMSQTERFAHLYTKIIDSLKEQGTPANRFLLKHMPVKFVNNIEKCQKVTSCQTYD